MMDKICIFSDNEADDDSCPPPKRQHRGSNITDEELVRAVKAYERGTKTPVTQSSGGSPGGDDPRWEKTTPHHNIQSGRKVRKVIDLGTDRELSIVEGVHGDVVLELRRFSVDGKKVLNFVQMNQKNYLELRSVIQDDCSEGVRSHLQKIMEGQEVHQKWHLGSNLYVSVDSPYKCVQIREWNQTPSGRCLATRIGISLSPSSFKKLCSIDVDMDKLIPELCDTTRCAFSPDHQNMLGALACGFCNPNGYLNY